MITYFMINYIYSVQLSLSLCLFKLISTLYTTARIFKIASFIFLIDFLSILLWYWQENIFGENQSFTDMNQESCDVSDVGKPDDEGSVTVQLEERSDSVTETPPVPSEKEEVVDNRKYRPFEVKLLVRISNVTGHLMKVCWLKSFVWCFKGPSTQANKVRRTANLFASRLPKLCCTTGE